MRRIFVDTVYWMAVTSPSDPWKEAALAARRALGGADSVNLVTTQEVLVELMNGLAGHGSFMRAVAATSVHSILNDERITVRSQSHESFTAGLDLYERRPDKGYSLVDCISMQAMRELGITEILTGDHHFIQEGFTVLLQR